MCIIIFKYIQHFIHGPGFDSASNRNEYQEYFVGVKAAGALVGQPYHLHVQIVMKSGSLNLLEPSGPVQACNGIDLPLQNFIQHLFLKVSHAQRQTYAANLCF